MRTVCGVGINDCKGLAWSKCYTTWHAMLRRCYSKKYQKNNPTYAGCSVCKDWLRLSNFKKWFDVNYPTSLAENLEIKFHLDKDLLVKGNKEYSPETCVFLPQKVNHFLEKKRTPNKYSGCTGVDLIKSTNKWVVHIRNFDTGIQRHLGCFESKEDASKAYQLAKKLEAEKVRNFLKELGYPAYVIDKVV